MITLGTKITSFVRGARLSEASNSLPVCKQCCCKSINTKHETIWFSRHSPLGLCRGSKQTHQCAI